MSDQENRPIRTLDLCGEVCPYTFVRTKLLLEEMAAGEELEILLDHQAAFTNVPRALRADGHQVLHVEISSDGGAASIHARKGPASTEPARAATEPAR